MNQHFVGRFCIKFLQSTMKGERHRLSPLILQFLLKSRFKKKKYHINVILDKDIIPESQGKGILIPIFKNKGSKSDPNSCRGVTLNLCISKMFSAILNNRLKKISDKFELITNAQAGFRKGFSTNDNIFILHTLISIYFSFWKKIVLFIY